MKLQLVGLDVICKEIDLDAIHGDVDALERLYNARFPDSPVRYLEDDWFERIGIPSIETEADDIEFGEPENRTR